MVKKTISSGVVVTDGNNILLCHVTGTKNWDLPKGKVDPGESTLDAAVRELKEETSLIVDPTLLIELGTFKYKKQKDLSLWLCKVDSMPDTATLNCVSTFVTASNIVKTEMDGFASVPFNEVSNMVVSDMNTVLEQVFKLI